MSVSYLLHTWFSFSSQSGIQSLKLCFQVPDSVKREVDT